MDRLSAYKLLQADLYDYFNLINSLLCNRCIRSHYQQLDTKALRQEAEWVASWTSQMGAKGLPDFGTQYFHVHHDFHLAKCFFSEKLTQKLVQAWFSD